MHVQRRAALAIALTGLAAGVLVAPTLAAQAAATHAPTGGIDSAKRVGNDIQITGWARDADSGSTPASVGIRLDGVHNTTVPANLSRQGVKNGFSARLVVMAGTHQVCASVFDYPSKSKYKLLGCRTVVVDRDPIGAMGTITQSPGAITVTGWGIDRDLPKQPLTVTISVDGRTAGTGTADQPVDGLETTHPVAGADHGFAITVPVTEGTHSVCAKLTNLSQGKDKTLPCVSFTADFSPHGKILGVAQIPGGFRIAGWAVDPDDRTATTTVSVYSDGKLLGTAPANGPTTGHSFRGSFLLGSTKLGTQARNICVVAKNIGRYGKDKQIGCVSKAFNWNPVGGLDALTMKSPGARVQGWATDPDTTDPIKVRITEGTKTLATVTANAATGTHPGHSFDTVVPLGDGTHTICVTALNTLYGNANSAPSCQSVTLKFEPYGAFESVSRATGSTAVVATGWAIDPDTTGPVPVRVSVDGASPVTTGTANLLRKDIAKKYPGTGTSHGFAVTVPASSGEHRVCVSAVNVLGGSGTTALGCKIINAVNPKVTSAPTTVKALAGYGGARISWVAPTSDGGAPWSGYTIRALPNGPSMTVGPTALSATLLGLKPNTKYSFSVVAINVAGQSAPGVSAVVTTEKEPPAQTTPAPISTSRYIRNVRGASSSDLAMMKREGATDAKNNPSGHGYMIMLAVGGQDESRQGTILTAGVRYVSYSDMVKDLKSYIDGYASQQKPSAPVTLAISTNNDIDVYRSSGVSFANKIVDPLAAYAAQYPGITIAGANDMEPGFRASYASTKAWLQGFLSASTAPFVNTGSADGCAWSYANGSCNNGWTAAGLYYLTGGAYSIRMINMPQVYNYTMAEQWRYISLTGVLGGGAPINFGGALTEYTACAQAGSCGSLTAPTAWRYLWTELRAEPRLRVTSLPYSTDLRIDS